MRLWKNNGTNFPFYIPLLVQQVINCDCNYDENILLMDIQVHFYSFITQETDTSKRVQSSQQ